MCVLITVFAGPVNYTFWIGGYMNIHMDEIGLKSDYFGWVVFAQGIIYIFFCLITPLLCPNAPRRLLFVISIFGFALMALLIGPSQWLKLPDVPAIICVGVLGQGVFYVFVNIPIVPELIDRLQWNLKAKEGEDDHILYAINDKVNDANSLMYALGNFIGPIIGSWLADTLNSPYLPGEIIFVFDVVILMIIFIFNCGFTVFKENKEF